MTDRRLYKVWYNMIYRCYSKKSDSYKNYGARGITVCEAWRNSFQQFVDDMGPRPDKYTLDRKEANGNYEPSNCRWADKKTQSRNTRARRLITIDGVEHHVADLQDKYGVDMRTIHFRYHAGMPFDKIVSKDRLYNNSESQKKAIAARSIQAKLQTHCKNGHEFTEENTYLNSGRRHCRKCRQAMDKFLYYKKTRPLTDFL